MSTEALHIYGAHNNLQGIASIPDTYVRDDIAVILLNAGMVRKTGPFNLHTDLARKFSSQGYFAFRFDLAGLGDSTKIKTGQSNIENAMHDIKETMSHIESQYDIDKFIVMGLCTGADHAHKIAVLDDRVIGNVWLDGYGYPTSTFLLKRILPVILNPVRLSKSILNRTKNLFIKPQVSGVDAYVWKLPPKNEYTNEMQKLHKRGFRSLYLFSGGVHIYYNYKNQFSDSFKTFDFWNNIELEYYPKFDHTYILINDRNIMIDRVLHWLNDHFNDKQR